MKLFENRILYSFYCFEQWIDGSFHMLFRGVKVWSMKKMYNLNPFGYIKKRNKSLDEYINNVYLAANEAAGNLDYGLRISHAQGFLGVLLGPYMMLAVSLVKYYGPVNIPNTSFKVFVLVCLGVSYLIAYLSAFKDDVYKAYFKKFKKEKNDLKWHVLTFFVCLGSLYSVYLSIVYWNKQNGFIVFGLGKDDMAKKRIQNRIGDIYYVTLEDGARIYLQYVAIDTEQLYSPGNTNHLTVSHKWYVWTINQKYIHIGDLVGEYKSYSMGFVYPPYAVYQKIITGKYPFHELK